MLLWIAMHITDFPPCMWFPWRYIPKQIRHGSRFQGSFMRVWNPHIPGHTVGQGLDRGGQNARHSALEVHDPLLSSLPWAPGCWPFATLPLSPGFHDANEWEAPAGDRRMRRGRTPSLPGHGSFFAPLPKLLSGVFFVPQEPLHFLFPSGWEPAVVSLMLAPSTVPFPTGLLSPCLPLCKWSVTEFSSMMYLGCTFCLLPGA